MAKPKQQARLGQWKYNKEENRLTGRVYGHPAFDDGDRVHTSVILSPPDSIKEDGVVETKNTIYTLSKPFTGESN